MQLHRLAVVWAGSPVKGLSVNVLHFDATEEAAPPVAAVLSAYGALQGILSMNTGITVPGSGDTIDDVTGNLTGVWTASGGGSVVGSAGQGAAAGVGACVTWLTGGIVNARRLRGRTFVVPLATAAYDSDGTLTPTAVTAMGTFANAMQAAGGLAVWHRPIPGSPNGGTSYGVIGNRVRDRVAYLSSRRD